MFRVFVFIDRLNGRIGWKDKGMKEKTFLGEGFGKRRRPVDEVEVEVEVLSSFNRYDNDIILCLEEHLKFFIIFPIQNVNSIQGHHQGKQKTAHLISSHLSSPLLSSPSRYKLSYL